jgi:peptidyl-prolyl cis-trans isomerase B (cyclophilin B)
MKARIIFTISVFLLFLSGCGKEEIQMLQEENRQLKETVDNMQSEVTAARKSYGELQFLSQKLGNVKVRITTSMGEIDARLFPDKAPITCFAFATRAECGYYDNTQFHRIIPGFMIQGGDPNSKDKDMFNDGQGGPFCPIPHEFNDTKHEPGILSMARVGDTTQGAGSQFFIVHANSYQLDNKYTAFGQVVSGMDIVDKIAKVETNKKDPRLQDHPLLPVIIRKIEVYR